MANAINHVQHQDIRIGTIVQFGVGADYIRQILPHGFECFQLFAWQYLPEIDLPETAKAVRDACGDSAVISSLGMFGNPLQDEKTARDWETCIRSARLFGCGIVAGFAGALEDRPVPESLPKYKEVFGRLAKIAEDEGVKIAFENCDMGGTWERPKFNIAHRAPRLGDAL